MSIPREVRWFAEDLEDGTAMPFLGAGASLYDDTISRRPPSAAALAEALAAEVGFPGHDNKNLALVSSWYQHVAADRPRLENRLRRNFGLNPDRPLECNDLHHTLAQVAKTVPMAIFTTNYDELIENALRKFGVAFDLVVVSIPSTRYGGTVPAKLSLLRDGTVPATPITAEQPVLSIRTQKGVAILEKTVLIKLHGEIPAISGGDTAVVTEEDYATLLGGLQIPADLTTLATKRQFYFLGYALRDWTTRVLLDRIARMQRMHSEQRRSIAVVNQMGPEETKLWEARLVTVLNADLMDVVRDLRLALRL